MTQESKSFLIVTRSLIKFSMCVKFHKIYQRINDLQQKYEVKPNFNGSNIFMTIVNCSRRGQFELLRVIHDQESNGDNLGLWLRSSIQ